ncbi:MAG: hypothetical protein NHF94_01155 [Candidatus Bostrichicola ureolyticus]|nr:MAG: hypothetical protein NHF94_01155 [Candidatus Bostrichicola ureolyticus]
MNKKQIYITLYIFWIVIISLFIIISISLISISFYIIIKSLTIPKLSVIEDSIISQSSLVYDINNKLIKLLYTRNINKNKYIGIVPKLITTIWVPFINLINYIIFIIRDYQ